MATKKQVLSRLDTTVEAKAFIERIKAEGLVATSAQMRKLNAKLKEMQNFHPKVGVLGKTGVGKSSLCNAMFGKETAKVSSVKACTRAPQEVLVKLTPDGAGMTLVDVPGVGESQERDEEYQALYETLLPELDLVLWVLKADDRAFSVDERFYHDVVLKAIGDTDTPIIFVINQVDKLTPIREWDDAANKPGKKQALNIKTKVDEVRRVFKHKRKMPAVVPVSVEMNYGLVELVNTIVERLPDEKKLGFAREVCEEHVSPKAELTVKRGFWAALKSTSYKIFVDVAPAVIEAGVTWVIKAIPTLIKAVV